MTLEVMGMNAVRIKITSSSMAHGRFNIRPCGRDFYPPDAYGSPSRSEGTGKPIILHPAGFDRTIETDLPMYRNGRPRWIFRDRAWVREFCRMHKINAGDERQGNLFFSIAAILEHHQPPAFVLENVKHLCREARRYAISA